MKTHKTTFYQSVIFIKSVLHINCCKPQYRKIIVLKLHGLKIIKHFLAPLLNFVYLQKEMVFDKLEDILANKLFL